VASMVSRICEPGENLSATGSRIDGGDEACRSGGSQPRFSVGFAAQAGVLRRRNVRFPCLAVLSGCLVAQPAGARTAPASLGGAELAPDRSSARLGRPEPSLVAHPAVVQAPVPSPGLQVLVKLTAPSDDGAQIAAEASRISGLSVRYVSATSPQWHALLIECANAASCEAAMQRLSEARDVYLTVQRDERARVYQRQ